MRKLLIVEDNLTMQKILEHYFNNDFQVILKNNGKEAITWMNGNRPDIIIADIQMPVMNGFDFIQLVKSKEESKNIPLLVLSYLDDKESKKKCLDAGADDYLIKPFSPAKLASTINDLLEPKQIG